MQGSQHAGRQRSCLKVQEELPKPQELQDHRGPAPASTVNCRNCRPCWAMLRAEVAFGRASLLPPLLPAVRHCTPPSGAESPAARLWACQSVWYAACCRQPVPPPAGGLRGPIAGVATCLSHHGSSRIIMDHRCIVWSLHDIVVPISHCQQWSCNSIVEWTELVQRWACLQPGMGEGHLWPW